MSKGKEIICKTLIGRNDREFIFLERVFDHGGGFTGAVGHSLQIVTKAEYDERTSDDNVESYCEDYWRMAVSDGNETGSLADFVEQFKANDGVDSMFDSSWSEDHDICIQKWNEFQCRERGIEPDTDGTYGEEQFEQLDDDERAHMCEAGGGGRMFCKDGTHGKKWEDLDERYDGWEEAVKMIAQYEKHTMAEEEAMRAEQAKKYQRT